MSAQPGQKLIAIFGGREEVGDRVKGFDFSRMSTIDTSKDDFLHLGLAPSYGSLSLEAIKKMDDGMKVVIAGTMRTLERVPAGDRYFDTILSNMLQNPLLEVDDGRSVNKADKLVKNSSSDFKTDGSPDAAIVQEVKTWFSQLVEDEDVIKATKFDVDVLAKIVAQVRATADSFESRFARHEYHEKQMVDITVLRFPDLSNPFFKLYRIQLKVWSDSSRIRFHQEDKCGITGEYSSKRFKPRSEIIDGMSQQSKQRGAAEAETLFN